jgi:tRNA dimethylallyltransferase
LHFQKTVVVITGPTAVGKTGIAIELAKHLDTAIVSADSRQCYQGMRIGTAQPSLAQLAAVPHYFIDTFPITQPLNAADFEQLALGYLEDIFRKQNAAVVCGGTGLYIRALCQGLDEMPAVDPRIARKLNQEYEQHGIAWLQKQLTIHDPAVLGNIDVQNPARLLRALIFKQSTGQSILQFQTAPKKERPFRIIKIGLELPREILYQRITARVDTMMAEGFEDEAKALYPLRHLKNLQTVGYAELFDYFDGKTSLRQAVELIKQHTRNYAKRQLTWFRKDTDLIWMNPLSPEITARIMATI